MDLTLTRVRFSPEGIFGRLEGHRISFQALATLEHSFDGKPALPAGVYKCIRGQHQLAHHDFPFDTFEVTEIPGHTGILFHVGNFNADSSGCILVGLTQNERQIYCSKEAFWRFMSAQAGVDSFTLTVV